MIIISIAYCMFGVIFVTGQNACSGGIAINSERDASRISGCQRYSGDVTVSQVNVEKLDFGDLYEIYGNFIVSNNFNLKSVLLNGLTKVSGSMILKNNTQLIGIAIPKLTSVTKLSVTNNPNLNYLNADSITSADIVEISQTSIQELRSLMFKKCKSLEISGNMNLKSIELFNLVEASQYLSIMDNNRQSKLSLPVLVTINGKMTFKNLASISAPSLQKVVESMNLIENTAQEIEFPVLQNTRNNIFIISNKNLESIKFTKLRDIGSGLIIQNNPKLTTIAKDSFPELQSIGDKILAVGAFNSVEFPKLKNVDKAITFQSSGKLDCSELRTQFEFMDDNRWICGINSTKDIVGNNNNDSEKTNSTKVINNANSKTQDFIDLYYKNLSRKPQNVLKQYADDARISWNGNGMQKTNLETQILSKLGGIRFEVMSHDCHAINLHDISNGMVVVVNGYLHSGNLSKQPFSQVLILVNNPSKKNEFYIQDDCFRYV
ncbi:hypothetical protein BB559_000974 [Furculomyces boomerangus]|uniref:NTF2 domain-containing protein n=1 Tax=Furculomyces boomerangus TaxID=61424 RepID=A0A2T9Z3N4_9FUNG|nr:hypothetical protein BB559_000974 [Furculomyces boomerangus]